MLKTIKTAILGQGRSGRGIHAKWLVKNLYDKFRIDAVIEPLEERRERAEKEFGCKTFEDYHHILDRKDLDLVINTTPSHLHFPITLDLINAGFNVICEKPLAGKVEEVDKLIKASKKSGKLFTIFQQSRYAPYFIQVKNVIDSGVLGRIVQISIAFNSFARRWDWQCIQDYNGGSLLNTGPHPLDQALQLLETDEIPEVKCVMDRVNTSGDAEDYVKLILQVPGRPVIDLEISSCCAYPNFTYNVQGSNGGLQGSTTHIDWKYFKPEEAGSHELVRRPLTDADGNPVYCSEQLKWYSESWDVPENQKNLFETITTEYYRMIYRVLAEGAPLEITPEQVRRQIVVIEECHRQNPLSKLY